MRKVTIKIFICYCLLQSQTANISSDDYEFMQYLPLQTGNTWIYKWTYFQPLPLINDTGYYRVSVAGIVTKNNKNYYFFNTTQIFHSGGGFGNIFRGNLLRIDSITGNVMKYDSVHYCPYSPGEQMVDSLKMELNDSINYECMIIIQRPLCNDTSLQKIFGDSRSSKSLLFMGIEAGQGKRFVKGIGISSFGYGSIHLSSSYTLMGCVINGIVYGDTNFIGIKNVSSEVPESFSLFQNYPNPFNPATKIRFDIPSLVRRGAGLVVLKVYDILGREVVTLVKEQLSPGTYEVEWDGSNLSSGVYYYRLTVRQAGSSTGDYTETKKMVLIK
jgi:hypothetical protein